MLSVYLTNRNIEALSYKALVTNSSGITTKLIPTTSRFKVRS